ncbi:unnamed protein product, partial [Strongylus vulgaris]
SPNAFVQEGHPIITPTGSQNLHQEVELGVVFGKTAKSPNAFVQEGHPIITPTGSQNLHQEVELGVVFGKTAKAVTRSEAMSYIGGYIIEDPHAEEIFCRINGVEKQRSKTNAMIFDIPTLIEYLTRFVTMEEGDVLLTGTPAGVCRVLPGDCIEFGITNRITCNFVVQ